MRRSKRAAAAALGVALLLGWGAGDLIRRAPVVRAEDVGDLEDPEDLKFFKKHMKKARKSIAAKIWDVAMDAKAGGFNPHAKRQAERTIQFNPGHKDARDYLGYEWKKKKKEWVLDEAKNNAIPEANIRSSKESEASQRKRLEKWKGRRDKVNVFIAKKYAQVGTICKGKGHEDQAAKAWGRAMALDPNNAEARKGMGYTKVGKVWLTARQIAAVKRAQAGKPVTGTSEWEKGLRVKLHKMESPHFVVEDDGGAGAGPNTQTKGLDLAQQIKELETLYAYYLLDAGIDPSTDVFDGQKARMLVVSTQPPWEKWVDDFSNAADKKWTKGTSVYRSVLGLYSGTRRVETAEHIDTRDPLLHHAAHMLTHKVWNIPPPQQAWLDEGMAYYYTVKIQETTRTSCVAQKIGGYAKGDTIISKMEWETSERWLEFLHTMVKKRSDIELRALMNKHLAELDLPQTVKAWAVISWLMKTRRDEFQKFLSLMKGLSWSVKGDERNKLQEQYFREAFGSEIEQVDDEWRAYARRAY